MSILSPGIITGGGGGSGSGGGIPEAPNDGKNYGRKNGDWAPIESAKYRHVQGSAAIVWDIQHNLGSKPLGLWTFDNLGSQIFGEPDYISATLNLLSVTFSKPVSGTAFVYTLI
jgi:hypothetical protein